MSDKIVYSSDAVTLVGGGEATPQDLRLALDLAPELIAADGGAALPLRMGLMPRAVIGDLDSLGEADRARLAPGCLHHIAEQDSTDFDKALDAIVAPLILAVGFLGHRVDHQLAGFNTLLKFPHQTCLLLGQSELVFLAPPELSLELAAGDVVSLFPMVPVTGRSKGLEWPIDGLMLAPGAQIGTSNRATGPVQLSVDAPGLLVIVPRSALSGIIRWLGERPDDGSLRWPARA